MMRADPLLLSDDAPAEALVAALTQAWAAGRAVGLAHPAEAAALAAAIGAEFSVWPPVKNSTT